MVGNGAIKKPDHIFKHYQTLNIKLTSGRASGHKTSASTPVCTASPITWRREIWRSGILGNRLTRAVARKNNVKRWWWWWWWWYWIGSAPHPSSSSLTEYPNWQRLDPPVGRETLEDHLHCFPWRLESQLYEGIIYVLYVWLQWLKNTNDHARTFLQCRRESGYGAVVIVTFISREP